MIKRIIIGKLKTLTGLHIGSGEVAEVTDALVCRNIDGDLIIPGTSLAGALRALATRLAPYLGCKRCITLEGVVGLHGVCNCPVCSLFGVINPGGNENEGNSSKIWFYDAVLEGDIKTVIRDGVGIDRETKTASRATRAKYDFEVVPKDTVFSFRFELHDELSKEEKEILTFVLTEWQKGRGYLGGNKARGLGNIELTELKAYRLNLSEQENLMSFLQNDDLLAAASEEDNWLIPGTGYNAKLDKAIERGEYLYNSFVQLDFVLKFTGGFVVNDALVGIQAGFDFSPRMENGKFVFPGSSIRGVLRSHAEKIARTIATLYSTKDDFLNKCPACNPLADLNTPLTSCSSLFREYKKKEKDKDKQISEEKLCLACRLFGSSGWGSRLYISDGYPINPPKIKILDFLAIDRFTGGGKEGAKFDALVLWQPAFRIRIFVENVENWSLGWLMLVLKDVKEGFLSFGGGENKWFGKAMIKDVGIKVGVVAEEFLPSGLKMTDSKEGIFFTQKLTLDGLFKNAGHVVNRWIQDFHFVLTEFKREENFSLKTDTYFNNDLEKNYPKEVLL
ncbi:MAG TPA: hypothetical protein GXZ50_08160 [Clostridia bacterium]|nr:hypothetical protein [Clostridia bacterium]